MAQFKFKLEKVLEYRQRLEEEAMLAFSKARAELDGLKADRLRLRGEVAETDRNLCDPALTGADRWLQLSYRGALLEDIAFCDERVRLMEPEVERLRLELTEKAQERQLLEKLKEKQAERHLREEKQKEQREYDETATLRFRPQAV